MSNLENANPIIHQCLNRRTVIPEEEDDDVTDKFDNREVFDLLRNITDPEHPHSLEELNVIDESHIQVAPPALPEVDDDKNTVIVRFTPTIPHCSMATLIGLSIRVKLLRALPPRFKVDISISPGTHISEQAVNKQLADKERVAAALENVHLLEVVNQCLKNSDNDT